MAEPRTHSIVVEVSAPSPAEVPAGADFTLKPVASCAAGCDLGGAPFTVTTPDGKAVTGKLVSCEDGLNASGEVCVQAPRVLGAHVFNIVVAACEHAGTQHEESALALPVKTLPHGTSLAAWDIPSPAVVGRPFNIKVGAKSASACALEGCGIAVCDEAGAVVGRGRVHTTPWPGTQALYWTTIELPAPVSAGICSWSVMFAPAETELPHEASSAQFSFAVVEAPEHRLTVKVVEKETKVPIENALVRLGAFRAATDRDGIAQVQTSKGAFDLVVWKAGYESPPRPMQVNEDLAVEIEAVKLPEDNPDTYWTM